MIVRRDRPLRALELLAAADSREADPVWRYRGDTDVPGEVTRERGLYITTLIEQAGEFVNQRTLTWFGHVLRDAETRGWTERVGQREIGQGRPIRWAITPAGRQHVLDVQARRSVKAAAEKAADDKIRTRNLAMRKARRDYDKATATRRDREQVTIMLRDAGVSWRDIATVTGYTYQTARTDYAAGQRQWPTRISPRSRTVAFSPRSPKFDSISTVLSDETGLDVVQVKGLLTVMHALGMRVQVPPGFRFRAEPAAPPAAVTDARVSGG
jgi:hypothetical protein